VLIAGIFFVMSALEINTDSIKNTFDDDYDHYIQPDLTPVHATIIQFQKHHQPVLTAGLINDFFFTKDFFCRDCAKNNQLYNERFRKPPKIYLLHGLMRI
jgi:hypothetical protein